MPIRTSSARPATALERSVFLACRRSVWTSNMTCQAGLPVTYSLSSAPHFLSLTISSRKLWAEIGQPNYFVWLPNFRGFLQILRWFNLKIPAMQFSAGPMITLTKTELRAITGFTRPSKQLEVLRSRGFHRAFIDRDGTLVLERAHFEHVSCSTVQNHTQPAANLDFFRTTR